MTQSSPLSLYPVGYILDTRFLEHTTPSEHPERPDRLKSIEKMLEISEIKNRLKPIKSKKVDPDLVSQIHSQKVLKTLNLVTSPSPVLIRTPMVVLLPSMSLCWLLGVE